MCDYHLFLANETSTQNVLMSDESYSNNTIGSQEPIIQDFDIKSDPMKETQMAQCTVSSGDIKASAQATFSVKGFCLSRDMEKLKEDLYDIESKLLKEIYHLRVLIERTLPQSQYQRNDYSYNYQNYYQEPRQQHPPTSPYKQSLPPESRSPPRNELPKQSQLVKSFETTTTKSVENPRIFMTQSTLLTTMHTSTTSPTTTTLKLPVINTFLKSLESSKNKIKQKQSSKTTSVPVESKNEYIFYWKLDKFPKEFKQAKKNEIFSHVFNVKGLFLRIRAVLKFYEDESLLMDVEHLANVDSSDSMKFEISDGLVFMEIAEEKLFQFSFVIMDQKAGPSHDLISPTYWNTDSDGFLIQNSLDVLSNYLKNDTLLIKLIITF